MILMSPCVSTGLQSRSAICKSSFCAIPTEASVGVSLNWLSNSSELLLFRKKYFHMYLKRHPAVFLCWYGILFIYTHSIHIYTLPGIAVCALD